MLIGGMVGGTVNYFFDPEPAAARTLHTSTDQTDAPVRRIRLKGPPYLIRCLVVGVGAALLVPVFLFLTRSQLLDDLLTANSFAASPVTTAPVSTSAVEAPAVAPVVAPAPAPPAPAPTVAAPTTATITTPAATTVVVAKPAPVPVRPAAPVAAPATAIGQADLGNVSVRQNSLAGSYLVFFSLCVMVAIAGFRFIPTITDRFLQAERKAEQASQTAQQAKEEAEVSKQRVEETTQQLTQAQQTVESQEAAIRLLLNKTVNVPAALPTTTTSFAEESATLSAPGPGGGRAPRRTKLRDQLIAQRMALPDRDPEANDPQKGRWGGKPESDHYKLRAVVRPLDKFGRYCEVTLRVEAKHPSIHQLTGEVVFFIHPSFNGVQRPVKVQPDGFATLHLYAYGVFTAGAVTDDAEMLELDLADVVANDKTISEDFKKS